MPTQLLFTRERCKPALPQSDGLCDGAIGLIIASRRNPGGGPLRSAVNGECMRAGRMLGLGQSLTRGNTRSI